MHMMNDATDEHQTPEKKQECDLWIRQSIYNKIEVDSCTATDATYILPRIWLSGWLNFGWHNSNCPRRTMALTV